MYRYSTCWMGPVNYEWIQKNTDQWAGGRINVYGKAQVNDYEIPLPTMHKHDYTQFSIWAESFTSVEPLTLLELVSLFEKETAITIRWFDLKAAPGNQFF